MRAYKRLIPIYLAAVSEVLFVSPTMYSLWIGGEQHSQYSSLEWDEDAPSGVYSCTSQDNPILGDYDGIIVELEVWCDDGHDAIVGENGVVVTEHARIVAYDPHEVFAYELNPGDAVALARAIKREDDAVVPNKWQVIDTLRATACRRPASAFRFAQDVDHAPRDDTRAAACMAPDCAVEYALWVDRGPRDDTRAAACSNPYEAVRYAMYADNCPRDDTRAAACRDPFAAVEYARFVDCAPRDDTRAAACQDPHAAVEYAVWVDCAPRGDTRAAACRSPYSAFKYAVCVDRGPRDDTRAAACRDPNTALSYAKRIDGKPTPETWESARRSKELKYHYVEYFNSFYWVLDGGEWVNVQNKRKEVRE